MLKTYSKLHANEHYLNLRQDIDGVTLVIVDHEGQITNNGYILTITSETCTLHSAVDPEIAAAMGLPLTDNGTLKHTEEEEN